jgi:hypothetical protein
MATKLPASQVPSREETIIQVIEEEEAKIDMRYGPWGSFLDRNSLWLTDVRNIAKNIRQTAESQQDEHEEYLVPDLPDYDPPVDKRHSPKEREIVAIQKWLLNKALQYIDYKQKIPLKKRGNKKSKIIRSKYFQ